MTSYYRFVLDQEEAFFYHLPTNHILTLRLDVPEQWDVQQTFSIQDTDKLECDVHHCGDDDSNVQEHTGARRRIVVGLGRCVRKTGEICKKIGYKLRQK